MNLHGQRCKHGTKGDLKHRVIAYRMHAHTHTYTHTHTHMLGEMLSHLVTNKQTYPLQDTCNGEA